MLKVLQSLRKYSSINIIYISFFIILTCIVYHYNTKDLTLKIAYQGWGPQDYVNHKLYPENFKKDWPSGIMAYDNSLAMRVYYYLAKYFNISPTTTMSPYMFIQTLLFIFSVAFLSQTLFNNKIVTLLCVLVSICSPIVGLNLSRFGYGFNTYLKYPLYYGYANAFRIFALGFFLRNKYIHCFIFLVLSIYCHVTMGFFVLAFVGFYCLYKPRILTNKNFLIGIIIFLLFTVSFVYSIVIHTNYRPIPKKEWILLTKIFSCHWYPSVLKMFTVNAHREFFPTLLLICFFFIALRYHNFNNEKVIKIIMGSVGCVILTLMGIFFSEVFPVPFLIKISLQRSSGLITFLGTLFLIYYLYGKIKTGNLLIIFLAVYTYLILVFSMPGTVIFPLLLLLYSDIKSGNIGLLKINDNKTKKMVILFYYLICSFIILIFIISFSVSYFKESVLFYFLNKIFNNLWTPLQYFNPFSPYDFLLRGGAGKICPFFKFIIIYSILVTFSIFFLRVISIRKLNIIGVIILCILSLVTIKRLEHDQYLRWHNRYAEISKSYLELQLWARNNTPSNALFMPDPSHFYGWRDFSQRSSFGNLREWGYSAIGYKSDYNIYLQGLKRMREWGIEIKEVNDKDFKNLKLEIYGQKLAKRIKKIFYSMKSQKLITISQKYNINYIIMNKKYHKKKFKEFPIAFENNHFLVYKIQ